MLAAGWEATRATRAPLRVHSRKVTGCLLDLCLLFRQEPSEGDNVGVDGLNLAAVAIGMYRSRHLLELYVAVPPRGIIPGGCWRMLFKKAEDELEPDSQVDYVEAARSSGECNRIFEHVNRLETEVQWRGRFAIVSKWCLE